MSALVLIQSNSNRYADDVVMYADDALVYTSAIKTVLNLQIFLLEMTNIGEDPSLTFKNHIRKKTKTIKFNLHIFRHFRSSLTVAASNTFFSRSCYSHIVNIVSPTGH